MMDFMEFSRDTTRFRRGAQYLRKRKEEGTGDSDAILTFVLALGRKLQDSFRQPPKRLAHLSQPTLI